MSEPKFTEGDWVVAYSPASGLVPESWAVHYGGDCECVAEYVGSEADAHLIAASKDLYEALELALSVIDDFMPNVGSCALQNYENLNLAPIKGREALAKAKATQEEG